MIHSSRIDRLRAGLDSGRGVLILGPQFARTYDSLDLNEILESAVQSLTDSSGWDNLDFEDRLRMCIQSLGNESFSQMVCANMPSVYALEAHMHDFHRQLLAAPFPHIIDFNVHDLARAALNVLKTPYRYLASDGDLVTRPDELIGERTLIKVRGNCWSGDSAFTVENMLNRFEENPGLTHYLQKIIKDGPVFIYGFSPRSPILRLLQRRLGPFSGSTTIATRIDSVLWRQHWNSLGVELIDSGTYTELETKILAVFEEINRDFQFSEVRALNHEITDVVSRQFAAFPEMEWTHKLLQDSSLISNFDDYSAVKRTVRFLIDCQSRGIPIPSYPAAISAEMCVRLGDLALGRIALRAAILSIRSTEPFDDHAMSAIGRSLIRMGDTDRAQYYLQSALHNGPDDLVRRADDLAWLSRCAIDQMDKLRSKGRTRAVMELIARFLQKQASFISLVEVDAPPESELLRSVYYINLRLGRIMAVASAMAETSGDVYAKRACELLIRAIEIEPAKPDAYKAIRPLLSDRAYQTVDPKKWMALVASAPPAVQRRLGGR